MLHNPSSSAYNLFVSYADADRAWVEGYLLDALRQAGVSYNSETAFDQRVPRVEEFQRAVQQSERTLVVISPAYVADDSKQFAGLLAQSYGLDQATWPVIPLVLHPARLPAYLGMLTPLDATEPNEWQSAIAHLCDELKKPIPGPPPKPDCPYPGMIPFREEDARFFFGREKEISELRKRLESEPMLLIIGSSGCGKSSLVSAGLIPALKNSSSKTLIVRRIRPGNDPFSALSEAFGILKAETYAAIADPIRAVVQSYTSSERLLLVVDQLEELFTQSPKDQRAPFIELIQQIPTFGNCAVIMSLRADFYQDLIESPLQSIPAQQRYELGSLRGKALREAITQPPESVQTYIETGLVERLIADAGDEPGVLPLLQETMVQLWDKMARRLLYLRAYQDMATDGQSGLATAIAAKAERTLAQLSPSEQTVARRIFLRLVQFGNGREDTRRQQPISALRSTSNKEAEFEKVLNHLADNRLLTLTGQEKEKEPRVDIAHEVLINSWPALREWLVERRDAELTRRRLEEKANEWQRLGPKNAGLLDPIELAEAQRWLNSIAASEVSYDPVLPTFISASRKRHRTVRRLQLGAVGAIVLLLVSLLVIGLFTTQQEAINQSRLADQRRIAAETADALANAEARARETAQALANAESAARETSQALANAESAARETAQAERENANLQKQASDSRRLVTQSSALRDKEYPLSLLLALEALKLNDNNQVRGNLLDALNSHANLLTYLYPPTNETSKIQISPDGKWLATISSVGTISLWNVRKGARVGADIPGQDLAFCSDAKTFVTRSEGNTITFWNLKTVQAIREQHLDTQSSITNLSFSHTCQMLSTWAGLGEDVLLWDLTTQNSTGQPLNAGPPYGTRARFNADDSALVTYENTGDTLREWDIRGDKESWVLAGDKDSYISDVEFSDDGKLLAVVGCAYFPNGGVCNESVLYLWDARTHQLIGEPIHFAKIYLLQVYFGQSNRLTLNGCIQFSANRCDASQIDFFDSNSRAMVGEPLQNPDLNGGTIAQSLSGETLASIIQGRNIIVWSIAQPHLAENILEGHKYRVSSVGFSPDSHVLASAGFESPIILWNLDTNQQIGQLMTGHHSDINSLVFSADGKSLMSAGCREDDNGSCVSAELFVWDLDTLQPTRQLPVSNTQKVTNLKKSQNGKFIAWVEDDQRIAIWDVAQSRRLDQFQSEGDAFIADIAFNSNGNILAASMYDKGIILWEIGGQAVVRHIETKGELHQIVFSPRDDSLMGVNPSTEKIMTWDWHTGQEIGQLTALSGPDTSLDNLAVSPNGELLAVLGCVARRPRSAECAEPQTYLWELTSNNLIGKPLPSGSKLGLAISFDPTGERLAVANRDSTVILWTLDLTQWKKFACQIANRNLTRTEYSQYINVDPSSYDSEYSKNPTCADRPVEP